MKLVLGSVQLGMNYGILKNKKINSKEIKKIEQLVSSSKIQFIDTAPSYGESEKIIGKSKLKNLNIITKVKFDGKTNTNIQEWVSKKISSSLKRLKVKKIYGLLIHDYKDILGKNGKQYLFYLKELKKKKIINKIGLSIYDPKEIKKIWKFWKPDLVQVPLNPLDNRILDSKWINIFKKFKIKIYARSIFLQGILITDHKLPNINKNYINLLNKFKSWCYANNISKLKACLHFVKQFKKIDYLVVGFNNYNHLNEIITAFKEKQIIIPKDFFTNDLKMIDLRKWK